jgi:putative flippase GtrA
MIAVAITCFGNRYFTFADRKHDKFYKQYSLALVAGLVSLVPNMSVFLGLLHILPSKLPFILIAFSSGTALGIVSNYLLSDRFVFAVKH